MRLTDAGRSYINACKRIVEQVEDAEREASGEYRTATGDLTVTSPWGLGHMHLVPIACEFIAEYPDVGLRLLLTDRVLRPLEDHI
jgi:DNA-binding transcriptional LysR family regulator